MTGAVEAALSSRARAALKAGRGSVQGTPAPVAAATIPVPGLLDSLRHHLLAGETHYPDRPGMAELRRLVGNALPRVGYPGRGPDGVLITASEGESLFVALLGVGLDAEVRFLGDADGHGPLRQWMNARDKGGTTIYALGDRLFAADAAPHDRGHADDDLDNAIVIGSLDGLHTMRPFRLGFVAAPPETLKGITKWKQASSICSPAPSQRAALWALGVRP